MEDRELLAQLLRGETRLSQQTIAEILGQGASMAEHLVRLIRNVRLWHTEEAGRIAVFHAVKLLGAMKSPVAVDGMSDAIFLAYGTRHEDVLEELPLAFARIGSEATPALLSILEDSRLEPAVRSVAASGMEGIAVLDPSQRDTILQSFRERLAEPQAAGTLRGHVLNLLAHFRRPEDRALVSAALQSIPTALDIAGDDIVDYFEASAEPWEWAQYRLDPMEFYDDELA